MSRLLTGLCFLSLLGLAALQSAQAGVIIGGTRIIYHADKKETSISVKNPEKTAPFLIQSWVETYPEATADKPPFIITPPLFRLDAGKENIVRIVRTGGSLPEDRESVFWANIKSIPASESTDTNRLLISVKTKIKLFYRPSALKENAGSAYKKLAFAVRGDRLVITNPTPYYVSFNSITVGGTPLKAPGMIAPKSVLELPLMKARGGSVSWTAINDFGGVTGTETRQL